jgi:mannose-1-phosphate guanylyltransferase/phosphomannomutase
MFAIAKILEMSAKIKMNIEEVDKIIPKLYRRKINLECTREEKGKIMRKFMEDTMNYRQQLIDGVKIFLDSTDVVLCIPDKARDLVHLNVESDTAEKAEKLLEEYKEKISAYIS